jgi:hypothetical protein
MAEGVARVHACTGRRTTAAVSRLPSRLRREVCRTPQLRLLLAVRKLWRHAEYSRGELPAVPKLPPLRGLVTPPGRGGEGEEDLTAELERALPRHFSDLYMPSQLYGEALTRVPPGWDRPQSPAGCA